MYSITKLLIIPFTQKWKSFKYNACLAITRVIRGMSEGKLRQELCLESLQLCRWYRKMCSFYKVFKNEHPKYFFNLVPATRTVGNIPLMTKYNIFKNSFFFRLLLLN